MKTTKQKTPLKRPSILATSVAALLGASLIAGSAFAAADAWTGTTNANWDTGTNWSAGVPLNTSNVTFPGTIPGTGSTITLTAPDVAATLSFNSPVNAVTAGYTLTGGALALTGGTASDITMNQAVVTTIQSTLSSVGSNAITITSTYSGFGGPQAAVLVLADNTASNSFGGAVNVNSGTLQLNSNFSATSTSINGPALNIGTAGGPAGAAVVQDNTSRNIAITTAVTINSNGTFNLNGQSDSVASVTGSAGAVFNLGPVGGAGSLTTGSGNTSTTYNGTITGTGGGGSTAQSAFVNGTAAIFKAGTGTWTLGTASANNYTGTTVVSAGALNIQNGLALGAADGTAANGTSVLAGATLQLQGGISVGNEALSLTGAGTGGAGQTGALVNISGTNNFGGPITLTGATTISSNAGTLNLTNATAVAGAFGLTLNTAADTGGGSITGSINAQTSLTVNGTGGTWILNGNNSGFAGPITINNSAVLQAGSATALGNGSAAVTLNGTSMLNLFGNSETVGVLNAAAGTEIHQGSLAVPSATLTITGAGGVVNGTIYDSVAAAGAAGSLSLNINVGAANTFTIGGTAANGYEGTTTVTSGTLLVTNTSAPAASLTSALGGQSNTAADGVIVTNGASLALGGGVNLGTKLLSLSGAGTAGNPGALNNAAGTNTAASNILLNGAATINSASGNLTLTSTNAITGGGALTLAGAGNGTLANGLTAPVVTSVTKTGAGTWTLGAVGTVNNYTGATTISGGTLKAGVANAFGASSATSLTAVGATLDIGGFANTLGSLTGIAGTTVTNTGAAATLTVGTDLTSPAAFAGTITDGGTAGTALTLTKVGTGTLSLSGANSYTGATNVTAGVLNISNSNALGAATGTAATGTTVSALATLQLSGGIGVGNEALTLNGAGTGGVNQDGALVNVAGNNTWGGPLTLGSNSTITNNAAATTLTLSNTTGIASAGGGPFTLTLNTATATGNGVLAAGLTNAAVNVLTVNGTGSTWTLTGTNTAWTNNTININGTATLKAGALTTNAFGIGSIVNLPGGATLDLNGTNQVIGQLNATTATETVTSTGGAATLTIGSAGVLPANATALTTGFVGVITGPLNLIIAGNNAVVNTAATTFTIGGATANTYTGTTTVNTSNTLVITNTSASTAASGALGATGTVANGTVVQTGATLQLNAAGPAVPGVNIGNETLTLTGTGTAAGGGALNSIAGINTASGNVILGGGATTIAVTAGQLNLGSAANSVTGDGATSVLNLTSNQANPVGGPTFSNLLSNITSGVTAVNVNTLAAGNVGTWRLSGASTYTGATTVGGGVLQAGVATVGGATPTSGAFGINSAVTVNTPGTLDANGFNNTLGSLAGTGTVDNTSVTGATLTTGTAGSTTFSGVIKNTGGTLGLTKVGAATVFTLTGVNTYTGLTTVSQGMLVAGSANALGAGSAAPSATGVAPGITVANGASLELTFAGVVTGSTGPLTLTINGIGTALNGVTTTGALVAGGNSTFDGSIYVATNSTISANGNTLTLGTIAQPTEFLNKNGVNLTLNGGGAGKVIVNEAITGAAAHSDLIVTNGATDLNVANTYNGTTFIDNRGGANGVLNAGVANALPTANGRTTMKIDSIGGGASTLSIAGTTLNPAGANQAVASLEGTALSKVTLGANTLTIGFGTGAVDVNGTANANFAGVISGTGGITKDEASTQIFSGLNTYSGATTVINGKLQAGIGQAGAAGAFGSNSNVTVGTGATVVGQPAPTLELAGFNETIGSLSGNASGIVQDNFGALNSIATLTINPQAAGTSTFSGIVQDAPTVGAVGAGMLAITKAGVAGSKEVFAGLNTYTGATTVTAGTLAAGVNQVGTTGAFGNNSATTVTAPGTLDLAGFSATVGNLSGSGTVTNSAGAGILTINTEAKNGAGVLAATQTQFTGLLTNTGGTLSVVINDGFGAGTGVQSFTNNGSTYSGTTTVNSGATLDIDSGLAGTAAAGALGTGTLIINTGATIGTSLGGFSNSSVANAVTVNGNFNVTNITPLGGLPPGVVNGPYVPYGSNGLNSSGVQLSGVATLANAGVTTITTKSGYLDFTGQIVGAGSGGLTFAGNTYTRIGNDSGADVANTYTGVTTLASGYLLLAKGAAGAYAIPAGGLVIAPGAYVQYDAGFLNVSSNQINPNANVVVNGTLDTAGLSQAVNNLTGGGTIRLDSSAYNSIVPVAVVQGGVLTVNSGLFGGSIVDGGLGGQLVKNSAGKFVLTGASTYVGNTTVNAGILEVDGSIASHNTLVNPAGSLWGTGVIGGNLFNNGTVKPGDSPGTLTVTGNYSQTHTAALVIEIAGKGAGQHSVLAVGGAANLDGNLRILNTGSVKLKRNDKITLVTANGGVNGKFSTVNNAFETGNPLLDAHVLYHPNYVDLEFLQGSFLALGHILGYTPNQRAVAGALDSALNDRRMFAALDYLDSKPLGKIPHLLDLIAPEELQSLYTIGISQANVQSANLERRMDDIRNGTHGFSASGYSVSGGTQYSGNFDPGINAGLGGPGGKSGKELRAPSDNNLGVFITGVGEFTHVGDTYNASGYDLQTGGFTLGVDYKIGEHFAIGVNAGYARTSADLFGNGRVTVDGAKLGVYATYFTGGFYADVSAQGGYNNYDTRRSALAGTASGSTHGGEFNALFNTGYDFKAGGLTVGPTASVQYTDVAFRGFTESGSLLPLAYRNQSGESLRTSVGMKASYDWQIGGVTVRPELRAAWQHEFDSTAFAIDSSFANGAGNAFTVHGAETGRDSLLLGAGVAVLWNERTSTYVYYDGEIGRTNFDSHNVSGGVRMSF